MNNGDSCNLNRVVSRTYINGQVVTWKKEEKAIAYQLIVYDDLLKISKVDSIIFDTTFNLGSVTLNGHTKLVVSPLCKIEVSSSGKVFNPNPTPIQILLEKEEELEDEREVSVFPNPAQNYVTLQVHQTGIKSLTIYSYAGMLVGKHSFEGSEITVPLDSFSKGVYLLELTSGEKRVIKKLVVL